VQQLANSSWSGNRRIVVAVAAVVALSAAFLAGYVVRGRTSSGAGEVTLAPVPSPGTTGGSAAPAPGAEPGATCGDRKEGPLREDTEFTAGDGAGTVVRYSVSLPEDYYTACKQYPVLYALHGKTQNNASFMDEAVGMRKAMDAGALEQSVIVTPDSYSTGRWENRETGPAEDNFVKQLIPHVEKTYRVRPGPAYRLLTGFSMGGHGAIRFGLKYPEMFAAVWSVDGAMAGPEDYLPFVEGKSSGDFRILAVGGQLNGDRVRRLVDGLKERGVEIPYTHQDLRHEFPVFIAEDEKAGWTAMKYLDEHLGRDR
jgi:predicted esterase